MECTQREGRNEIEQQCNGDNDTVTARSSSSSSSSRRGTDRERRRRANAARWERRWVAEAMGMAVCAPAAAADECSTNASDCSPASAERSVDPTKIRSCEALKNRRAVETEKREKTSGSEADLMKIFKKQILSVSKNHRFVETAVNDSIFHVFLGNGFGFPIFHVFLGNGRNGRYFKRDSKNKWNLDIRD